MHWRILAVLGMLLTMTPVLRAKGHPLEERLVPGDCFRVELNLSLKGSMEFDRDQRKRTLPLEASATHVFPERILAVAKNGSAEKTARRYQTAKATIKLDKHTSTKTLRPERNLLVALWNNDQLTVSSPLGALYRNELELCSEHFDTLHLVGLLPAKEVNVGDTWKLANTPVQSLCHFDGLIEHSLTGKLEEVKSDRAIVSVKGTAKGIEVGAMVKLTIDATCEFDLENKRIVKVVWKQKDEREQGPASPTSTVESTTTVTRSLTKTPEGLDDKALAAVPAGTTIPPQQLQLDYQHPKETYNLLYTRDWQIVSETEEHLVMRLMDKGDFVAQATITNWSRAQPGKTMTAAQLGEVIERTPGWKPEKDLQAGLMPSDSGVKIYRISQVGKYDNVDAVQNFYHLANEDGRQLVVAVVLTPKQADKLGTRDLSLVGSLDFPKGK